MNMIFQKAIFQKEENLPFVLYRKPNSELVQGVFQKNNLLYHVEDFSEKGFVFAPFNKRKTIIIPFDESEIVTELYSFIGDKFKSNQNNLFSEKEKKDFESLVEKAVTSLNNESFSKVVVSRKEKIKLSEINEIKLFQRVLSLYPTAFCYCFFHPEVGLWLGASPEQFINIEEGTLKTVALAGTQVYNASEAYDWSEKEKQEQQYVTDFILKSLEDEGLTPTISDVYTFRAGSVVHLKTDIQAKIKEVVYLKSLINKLHPTPAVCGLPKEKAMDFILKQEGYERGFYTGFLGELNKVHSNRSEAETDLYVNLRCMEIKENNAFLYLGCGITKESEPEKEFFETVNKANTMKSVLY